VSIECGEALTEESNYGENKQRKEAPILSNQIILTIGDVVIEVHKGKVSLRCCKECDILNAFNST
jgi:hypothetical protein